MKAVGEIVLGRLVHDPDTNCPWSWPVATIEQKFEWFSSTWAWSLYAKAPKSVVPSWSVPGWSHDLPEQFPQWLNLRASSNSIEQPFLRGATLAYFMNVVRQWSIKRRQPPNNVPVLLRPAMLWRASSGDWPVDVAWWGGIIGTEWAEKWLIEMLTAEVPDQRRDAARILWPSLVAWQQLSHRKAGFRYSRGKELDFPSCRPDARLFSPVLAWVASQLADEDVFGLLTEEDRLFLENHPQWLLTPHKLLVLRALAQRLPLSLQMFEIPNYFSPFVPDAVEGLIWFLPDPALGVEAASGVWNWAPARAHELLTSAGERDFNARRQLLMTCPTSHLSYALSALRRTPALLPAARRLQWVQYHLPYAGEHALQLFEVLQM